MKPHIPKILAACSLILNSCALIFFVRWLFKLKVSGIAGHVGFQVTHRGPVEWLIAALVLSILGVLTTVVSLIGLTRKRGAAHPTHSSWLRVLTGLALLGVTAPAIGIIPGSALLLPSAQREARREAAIHDLPEIDRLLKALKDENYDVRRDAAQKLRSESWLPESAIPTLTKAAARHDGEPSTLSVQALAHFHNIPDDVAPRLVGLLDTPEIGPVAGEVLGGFGETGVDALLKASKSRDAQVRQSAAHGLGKCSNFKEEIIPQLTGLLSDENGSVRAAAAMSLGSWGVKSKSALPILQSMANDPDPDARSDAGWAAREIASRTRSPSQPLPLRDGGPLGQTKSAPAQ